MLGLLPANSFKPANLIFRAVHKKSLSTKFKGSQLNSAHFKKLTKYSYLFRFLSIYGSDLGIYRIFSVFSIRYLSLVICLIASFELLSEHMHRAEWMLSLHHHSDFVAMKSAFISALCRETPLGTWTKHKQTGHKQLLLRLVTWVNGALHMFVIREDQEETKLH